MWEVVLLLGSNEHRLAVFEDREIAEACEGLLWGRIERFTPRMEWEGQDVSCYVREVVDTAVDEPNADVLAAVSAAEQKAEELLNQYQKYLNECFWDVQ